MIQIEKKSSIGLVFSESCLKTYSMFSNPQNHGFSKSYSLVAFAQTIIFGRVAMEEVASSGVAKLK